MRKKKTNRVNGSLILQSVKCMIQYLIILLDDTSVSFCHYDNMRTERSLMPVETLKAGIFYGMKENLNIQFVYPDYDLPKEYNDMIETVDHVKIKPASVSHAADVVVVTAQVNTESIEFKPGIAYVLRLGKEALFSSEDLIFKLIGKVDRLNIVLTDVEAFKEDDFEKYKKILAFLSDSVEQEYAKGRSPQLNILTDRMMLDKMNNCGAGDTTVTLAPDGKFYICPAFYHSDGSFAVGNLKDGLNIKNPQLYKLAHAPLCRKCDAYQCRRCVWLNMRTTMEVNTPSHEQCVTAHLERNASRELLIAIRKHGAFLTEKPDIKKIDYLDPFEIQKEW